MVCRPRKPVDMLMQHPHHIDRTVIIRPKIPKSARATESALTQIRTLASLVITMPPPAHPIFAIQAALPHLYPHQNPYQRLQPSTLLNTNHILISSIVSAAPSQPGRSTTSFSRSSIYSPKVI